MGFIWKIFSKQFINVVGLTLIGAKFDNENYKSLIDLIGIGVEFDNENHTSKFIR